MTMHAPWSVCIIVPYGTHKWQVADAEQLNGELSRLFTVGKDDLLQKKSHHGMTPTITRLDIIPLFTPAWKGSFGDVAKNKAAMASRGWSVLNYFLLDDPDIVKTMTPADMRCEYTEVFGKHYGKSIPSDEQLERMLASSSRTDLPNSGGGSISLSDLNLEGGLTKRLIDDLVTGEDTRKARENVRKRARESEAQDEALKIAKQKMFDSGPTGGKVVAHNEFHLGLPVLHAVEKSQLKKDIEKLKGKIKKYDEFV